MPNALACSLLAPHKVSAFQSRAQGDGAAAAGDGGGDEFAYHEYSLIKERFDVRAIADNGCQMLSAEVTTLPGCAPVTRVAPRLMPAHAT
jgi:hypothetical protein